MNSRNLMLCGAITLFASTPGCGGSESSADEAGADLADAIGTGGAGGSGGTGGTGGEADEAPAAESPVEDPPVSAPVEPEKNPPEEAEEAPPVHQEAVSKCYGTVEALEPNDARASATTAPAGVTKGLVACAGDEDWFRIKVPAHTVVRVGIEMKHGGGDLDLVVYDAGGKLMGARYGEEYPYSYRAQETDSEYYGFYSEKGGAEYYVRVVGYKGAKNDYSLHVDKYAYKDGASCTGAGFSLDDCIGGELKNGEGLLPFFFADPKDSFVGDGYISETFSNYRFARRELIMLVRYAIAETRKAFPGTTTLSLLDVCQKDGITPGYDVGDPRHPQSTHDTGGNIDISYFQTDGVNDGEIVCGDGSEHADGYCTNAATKSHKVDLPRQAFFMSKLFSSNRTRVIGTDQVLAPLIKDAAQKLVALPSGDARKLTAAEAASFDKRMASGSGWPYHHHHIHLSLKWWSKNSARIDSSTARASAQGEPGEDNAPPGDHLMAWPQAGEGLALDP
jgi:hypothetical protein